MACFRVCFRTIRNQKKLSNRGLHSSQPRYQQVNTKSEPHQLTKPEQVSDSVSFDLPISGSKDKKIDDQLSSSPRTKVTSYSDAKDCEENSIKEVAKCTVTNDMEDKESEKEMKTYTKNQEVANCLKKIWGDEVEKGREEKKDEIFEMFSDSSMSSMISHSHRCIDTITVRTITNESEDMDDKDFQENGGVLIEEESSESLFSLSIESRKQVNSAEMDDKEVNSSQNHSVKNLTQSEKAIKATTTGRSLELDDHDDKENVNLELGLHLAITFSEEPCFKKLNLNSRGSDDGEDAVDTSLSSWLVDTGKTPMIKKRPSSTKRSSGVSIKLESRTILGALTVDQLKENDSVNSSPRKTPSHYSVDEVLMVGTIGSYWSHTGQIVDASDSGSSGCRTSTKFKQEKKVLNCHSTPFVERLENDLGIGTGRA